MTSFKNDRYDENKCSVEESNLLYINDNYILSCDIGTTKLRCMVFNSKAVVQGSSEEEIEICRPQPGYVEIDPDVLWTKFISIVINATENAKLQLNQIRCLGLSTQRATFVMWDRTTGKTLNKFVTWKDLRSNSMVDDWNNSWTMKLLRLGSSLLYTLSRKKRYFAASIINFQNIQVNMRLKYVLENDQSVRKVLNAGNLMFGTMDVWLIYKLTGGKVHASDHSNASGTAIYDPFVKTWSNILLKVLNLPKEIFPEIRDTNGFWGHTDKEIFGVSIPITAVVSDQGAALFGGCGFNLGDVKITLGTGAFFDVNSGSKPHTSIKGIYPVVGWKDKEGIVYMAEGSSSDNGTIIEWGKSMGFYKNFIELSEMAESVQNSNGVYFIPGFTGLQAPINDPCATGGFIGMSMDTKPEHLVRAMLESLAFRVCQIYNVMQEEASYKIRNIRVDGGVSQNDLMLQMISTLTNKQLERPKNIESSSIGCCFLAGLGAGIWNDRSEIEKLREVSKKFYPEPEHREHLLLSMKRWEQAVTRFTDWYKMDEMNVGFRKATL